jgi:putative ABC transport system permease protein
VNVLQLAAANLKKSKSAALFLFILMIIAGLLLNIGLTAMSVMNHFYENKVRELRDPHVSIAMNSASFKAAYGDFLASYPGVREMETEQVILLSTSTIPFYENDSGYGIRTMLLNADAARSIAPVKLIEAASTGSGEGIYVPYSWKVRNGYQLGDNLTITYRGKAYTYRITGVFESTLMGSSRLNMLKIYLPDAAYRQFTRAVGPEAQGTLMSAILSDNKQSGKVVKNYQKQFPHSNEVEVPSFWAADTETAKDGGGFIVNFVSMILAAFAAVIVLVSLIVIAFRIRDSIEDGIANIGVLQAMGYTSLQIILSYVVQFSLIAMAGSATGVAVSCTMLPAYGQVVSSLTGLIWRGGASAGVSLVSIATVTLLVCTVALLSAARIRRLHPAVALRGGLMTHHFKRNFFPLDQTKGGLQWVHACKAMMANGRQNLLIGSIMAAITFASVFSVVLYSNIAGDKVAFYQVLGSEMPDVGIQVQPGKDSLQLLAGVRKMTGVSKAVIMDSIIMAIQGHIVNTEISDQFEMLNNQTVYEGRYPRYDNEVAITGGLARLLGKSIGDSIKLEAGNVSYSFLITGLSQSFSAGGKGASLTLSGVYHLIPGLKEMSVNVYLEGVSKSDFIQNVKAEYGDMIWSVTNVDESQESGMQVYNSAVFAVMAIILAITVLVVVLILYLVIRTAVLKRRRELGILQAAGYTTFQLMTQVTLSIMPIAVSGVIGGGVLGGLYTNVILELMLTDAGIARVRFVVHVPLVAFLCMAIIALSFLVSLLAAYRIRKITPYCLIAE